MALTRITKGVIKPNENYDTHNINSTGIVTAVAGNFSGDLTVGGVLTYEDVTSIDSVGIITARNGIDCNGDIDVDGHTNLDNVSVAGVSTFTGASTFNSDTRTVKLKVNSTNAQIDLTSGQASFTPTSTDISTDNMQVYVNGIIQNETEDYTIGSPSVTITDGAGLDAGDQVDVVIRRS